MTFAAPWALAGFVILPFLWWILHRSREPEVKELPTLMFLLEEDKTVHAARARRIDVDGVLALAALVFMVLAAAAPTWVWQAEGRTVRVVVAGGAPSHATGYRDRVDQALASVRGALGEADRMVVVWEPPDDGRSARAPRPRLDALLGAARAGRAGLRVVVTDRVPEPQAVDVEWIGIGDPDVMNVGIVAATVLPDDPPRLFLTVGSDGPGVRVEIVTPIESRQVTVPPNGFVSTELAVSPNATIRLAVPPVDALESDNAVFVPIEPLDVAFEHLPAAHRAVTEDALAAVLGEAGYRIVDADADLVVTTSATARGAVVLRLGVVADAGLRPPAGLVQVGGDDPLVRDLRVDGVDWVLPESGHADIGSDVLLGLAGDPRVPLVLANETRDVVVLAADPTAGNPAPAKTPFWPLLIDNLVRERFPGAGVRVVGLLDPDASTLGRDVLAFDPVVLAGAPRDREAKATSWRAPLAFLVVALLLVLWVLPFLRARAHAAVVSGHEG